MLKEPLRHPADEIKSTKSKHLEGVKLVFGLTGSVSIYRVIDIMRELIRRGADVYVVMSKAATELINPTLIEWATGTKVFTEFKGETGHVALSFEGSSFTVAPASADAIAKIAAGIGDNPVTLTAVNMLGLGKPLILVPTMHEGLWKSPPIVKALEFLTSLGVTVLWPNLVEGRAKFPDAEDVIAAVEAVTLRGKDLRGLNILVTSGPTRERLDSVRYITNSSSGKMGVAIAREAYFRGANVTLIHGPLSVSKPYYTRNIAVESTEEMLEAVLNEVRSRKYDAVIMAAAPSDFRFRTVYKEKIKSDINELQIVLETTPKISAKVREVYKGLLIGFAAETVFNDLNKLIELAQHKLISRGFDYIVANDVSNPEIGFASDYNEVVVVGKNGFKEHIPKSLKEVVARRILDIVRDELAYGKRA
ncbi:MAG: hypothetical protein B7O98_07230 [Zestosphaera tikiterensis]|uniref:Coenzyme A biosynthesis bifunctional protein CoaBC n=1 Tax=Zestosphaera tikiterensis TaxID=1973259 RepID=A0A2R7Y4I1_9CREN|nr:MAG: hypothetical protein B7O98_07230 [Zestosphaera tikiterensis]